MGPPWERYLPRRQRWQLPCASTNFQADTPVRHLQHHQSENVCRGEGTIDNSAKFALRVGSSITIYDDDCRTFSILIMRSFCFYRLFWFFPQKLQVCALPVPLNTPFYFFPSSESLDSLGNCVTRRVSKSVRVVRNEYGIWRGNCEWEWEWVCDWEAEWESRSRSQNRNWQRNRNWFRTRIHVFNMRTLSQFLLIIFVSLYYLCCYWAPACTCLAYPVSWSKHNEFLIFSIL